MSDPEGNLQQIAVLDEPTRRALYRYVLGSGGEVSRDQAAAALKLPRVKAAFHLDRLVTSGLLEAVYRRLGDRRGPGAGRPSKLYRRSEVTVEASLPPRRYQLAAELLSLAFDGLEANAATVAVTQAARNRGRDVAMLRATESSEPAGIVSMLTDLGYEPAQESSGEIRLRNCPFHALAQESPDRICAMNCAFLEGALLSVDGAPYIAALRPEAGSCCVRLVLSDRAG